MSPPTSRGARDAAAHHHRRCCRVRHDAHPGHRTLVRLSRGEWIGVADLLADRFRTVALDAPGFGDARDLAGDSLQEMAQQFAQTINELALDRYVLVGHSMTGKIMTILASRMGPELGLEQQPEKLVLVTPTPLGQEVGGEHLLRLLLEQGLSADLEVAEQFVAGSSALPLSPEVTARAVRDYLRTSPAAWTAWLGSSVYEDWTSRAAPVATPALVVAADRDAIWGEQLQRALTLPRLQDATLRTVDCGHLVPVEAHHHLASLLRDFVDA